ncbi:MAG TPA: VOC family protein, partial [Alphaproteobacteria bacterium]
MTDWANEYIARCQVPASGTLVLDHVAHFVPDADEAATALQQLGFTVTPFSPQSHRPSPEAALTPAGTGNRCVMLRRGYLEFL